MFIIHNLKYVKVFMADFPLFIHEILEAEHAREQEIFTFAGRAAERKH